MVLTMGRLGARMGRRRLLSAAVAVYGLASLAAAFAAEHRPEPGAGPGPDASGRGTSEGISWPA
jgi:MFS family permease